MTENHYTLAGTADEFVPNGDGTFSCRRHQVRLVTHIDPDDADMRIATCPVCAERAEAIRGAILDVL